ncbi:hypothetical protein [Ignatzschineria sp. F8392]|uniref:hypothetical protein n=1 Tax=Ignatzschineria sp. F8392 TaxID=1980117 RepID=UPI00117B7B8E|nr:hypothetical protein [Ignatzschineria sp. F8392]
MSGFFILKKVRGAAGTHYFILITSACPQFGHFQCLLPARDFWKSAIVSFGKAAASVVSTNYFN